MKNDFTELAPRREANQAEARLIVCGASERMLAPITLQN